MTILRIPKPLMSVIRNSTGLPTLYKLDQANRLRQWTIECGLGVNGIPEYTQTHGLVDGKLQRTSTKISAGKNIGRSNETSAWDQCLLEAKSLWNKQRDRKGYYDDIKALTASMNDKIDLRPMLAKSYNVAGKDLAVLKDGKKIVFPCYLQPKLDGIRCIAVVNDGGSISLYSRQQKEWHILTHVKEALKKLALPTGTVLDGELYVHGEEFQNITSAIKRDKPSDQTANIQYHIYDMMSNDGYEQRLVQLTKLLTKNTSSMICQVETYGIKCHKDIERYHASLTKDGFEGVMVRNKTGKYKSGGRSSDLQKVKKFSDEEFKIVDAYECKGKMSGMCGFLCKTPNGTTFKCMPAGSEQYRKQLYIDWQKQIIKEGDMLTIRFFAWTTSVHSVPRFPVGISIRDYE